MKAHRIAVLIVAALLGGTAAARKPVESEVPAQVQRLLACRQLTDNEARLACYDKEAQAVDTAFTGGEIVAMDREKVRSTKRSLFGFAIPNLGVFGDEEGEVRQVEGVIAGVGRNVDGGYVFRLEDGARWSQTDGKPIALEPLRGDKVVIKRGTLGSYFLSVNKQPGVKVERVN